MEEFDIQNSNEKETTLNYPVIIGFVLILALIGGGTYWFLTRGDDTTDEQEEFATEETVQNEENIEDVETIEIDSTAVSQDQTTDETATQDAQSETNSDTTEATTDTTTSTDATTSTDNSQNVYFIVSGAFSSETNALNKVEKLKAEGYNAVIVEQNAKGLYIVAYEGYPDFASAKTKMDEMRTSNPKVWIYKKKN